VTYRALVGVEKLVHRFQTGRVVRMPEPVLFSQRSIGLGGAITEIAAQVEHIPIFLRRNTIFIPHPTYVAILKQSGIGKD
jgi:hypothetical protein